MEDVQILLLVPLVLVQIGIQVFALIDLIRRARVKGGNKVLWAIIVLLGGLLGALVYIVLGREEE